MNKELNKIIAGIDKEDIDGGWWETGAGVEYGARVKGQLEKMVDNYESELQSLRAENEKWQSLYSEWREFAEDFSRPYRAKCGHLVNDGFICRVCGEDPTV